MDPETLKRLLGIKHPVPLSLSEMATSLQICFYPEVKQSTRLALFEAKLRHILAHGGVQIISYEHASRNDGGGNVRPSVAIFAVGDSCSDDLPINHVSSLSQNVVVQVLEKPCPAHKLTPLQDKLNSVVSDLAWHCAQVVLYLDSEGGVTVCNMNGSIISCRSDAQVLAALIPKLAAPVVPPRSSDFCFREKAFDPLDKEIANDVNDLVTSGRAWKERGLMVSQTSIDMLRFQSKYYGRIVRGFLDHRTGMSYGFLTRQLKMPSLTAALTLNQAEKELGSKMDTGPVFTHGDQQYLHLETKNERYVVPLPDVQVIGTRSGCEKTQLDPKSDLVRYAIKKGIITFETSRESNSDCKPSYDTLVIVAHALANAIVASVLGKRDARSSFFHCLKNQGLALAHWHGFLPEGFAPLGYFVHGSQNPGVSCSTPQSAIYAMQGKLKVLDLDARETSRHEGDFHIEPHHGTNVTCASHESFLANLLPR
jgi:hypothetical protein